MDEEFTLDEMIEYYKLVNEIYKILNEANDDSAEQFTEYAEKYQRKTDIFNDDR